MSSGNPTTSTASMEEITCKTQSYLKINPAEEEIKDEAISSSYSKDLAVGVSVALLNRDTQEKPTVEETLAAIDTRQVLVFPALKKDCFDWEDDVLHSIERGLLPERPCSLPHSFMEEVDLQKLSVHTLLTQSKSQYDNQAEQRASNPTQESEEEEKSSKWEELQVYQEDELNTSGYLDEYETERDYIRARWQTMIPARTFFRHVILPDDDTGDRTFEAITPWSKRLRHRAIRDKERLALLEFGILADDAEVSQAELAILDYPNLRAYRCKPSFLRRRWTIGPAPKVSERHWRKATMAAIKRNISESHLPLYYYTTNNQSSVEIFFQHAELLVLFLSTFRLYSTIQSTFMEYIGFLFTN